MIEETRVLPELFDRPDENAMDFYSSRYFVINMHLLKFSGLWPYQNKIMKLIIRTIISFFIVVPAIPQIISARVRKDNIERLIQSIGTIMYFVGMGSKYFSVLLFEKKMEYLYKNIVENWKMLENEAERNIIKQSGEKGRLLTIGYVGYMIGAMQVFIGFPLLPGMINTFFPSIGFLNDTQERMLVLDGVYLVDRQKYYYHIYFFEALTCLITVPMFSTIDSTYSVCVEQCIGLLKIVRLRLKLATKQNIKYCSASHQTIDVAREAIIKSAILHEKVLNFGRILESSYSTSFLLVMMSSVVSLVQISIGILYNLHKPIILLRFIFILMGLTTQVFYLSWPGQKMINYSSGIYFAAYDNEWYECSIKSQELLKFIMNRSSKPLYLTAGGMYAMNFGNFEKIMRTSLSYITVLASFT